MTKETELKSCPFCGGKVEITQNSQGRCFGVTCFGFGCYSAGNLPRWATRESAINAWNTRPTVTPAESDAELLESIDYFERHCGHDTAAHHLHWLNIRTALQSTRKQMGDK